jgi:hypothetical protein
MEYNVELMSSVINLFVLGTTLFKKNLEFFELMVHWVESYNYGINSYSQRNFKLIIYMEYNV